VPVEQTHVPVEQVAVAHKESVLKLDDTHWCIAATGGVELGAAAFVRNFPGSC